MLGERAAMALLERALAASAAPETDIYLSGQDLALTRFANNAIHQNVSHRNLTLNIRAVDGRRLGRATTNDLSDAGLRRALATAHQNARLLPEDPDFHGLPEPEPPTSAASPVVSPVASWDEAAAGCSPATRAAAVAEVCRQGAAAGLNTAGACRTGVQESAVISSRGVRAYYAATFAGLIVTTRSADSAGWAKGGGWRWTPRQLASKASSRRTASRYAASAAWPSPVAFAKWPRSCHSRAKSGAARSNSSSARRAASNSPRWRRHTAKRYSPCGRPPSVGEESASSNRCAAAAAAAKAPRRICSSMAAKPALSRSAKFLPAIGVGHYCSRA